MEFIVLKSPKSGYKNETLINLDDVLAIYLQCYKDNYNIIKGTTINYTVWTTKKDLNLKSNFIKITNDDLSVYINKHLISRTESSDKGTSVIINKSNQEFPIEIDYYKYLLKKIKILNESNKESKPSEESKSDSIEEISVKSDFELVPSKPKYFKVTLSKSVVYERLKIKESIKYMDLSKLNLDLLESMKLKYEARYVDSPYFSKLTEDDFVFYLDYDFKIKEDNSQTLILGDCNTEIYIELSDFMDQKKQNFYADDSYIKNIPVDEVYITGLKLKNKRTIHNLSLYYNNYSKKNLKIKQDKNIINIIQMNTLNTIKNISFDKQPLLNLSYLNITYENELDMLSDCTLYIKDLTHTSKDCKLIIE